MKSISKKTKLDTRDYILFSEDRIGLIVNVGGYDSPKRDAQRYDYYVKFLDTGYTIYYKIEDLVGKYLITKKDDPELFL